MHPVQHPQAGQAQSAVRMHVQLGLLDVHAQAAATVLQAAIDTPFFAELRTKQQLGYVVQSGLSNHYGVVSLIFLVQGTKAPPPVVSERILAFMDTIPQMIANLSSTDFGSLADAARSSLLERPSSIDDKASAEYDLISTRCYGFDRDKQLADALAKLQAAEVQALAHTLLDPAGGIGRLLLQVYGAAQQPLPAAGKRATPEHFAPLDVPAFRKEATYLHCSDETRRTPSPSPLPGGGAE